VCNLIAACDPCCLPVGTQCATVSLPVALIAYLARSVRLGRCLWPSALTWHAVCDLVAACDSTDYLEKPQLCHTPVGYRQDAVLP
jgi:hypothetical protein